MTKEQKDECRRKLRIDKYNKYYAEIFSDLGLTDKNFMIKKYFTNSGQNKRYVSIYKSEFTKENGMFIELYTTNPDGEDVLIHDEPHLYKIPSTIHYATEYQKDPYDNIADINV